MTRYCSGCRQQRPLREFNLGGGQLSTLCLGCADERLRTEDSCARSQRYASIASLEKRRRELIGTLETLDADLAAEKTNKRSSRRAALDKGRREVIAALVKIDAEITDLRVNGRPTPPVIVLDDGAEVEASALDDFFGSDLADSARDEMS